MPILVLEDGETILTDDFGNILVTEDFLFADGGIQISAAELPPGVPSLRYRKLDASGDYVFGRGRSDFYVNTPVAIAQSVLTRLKLATDEWFLDKREGTPYSTDIVGHGTQATRDIAVQQRILTTNGVDELIDYSSSVDNDRGFKVSAKIDTRYGAIKLRTAIT